MDRGKGHSSQFIVSLALTLVFLIIAFFTTALGADIYRDTAETSNSNSKIRTDLLYITQRVHRAEGEVSIISFGGSDALALTSAENGIEYVTYIYVYEGELRELTTKAQAEADPSLGQAVFSAERLSLSAAGSVLTATVDFGGGREAAAKVYVRGWSHEG